MAATSRIPSRRRRTGLLAAIAGVPLAAAILVLAGTVALTSIEVYRGGAAASDAPAWARSCYDHEPRHDRTLLERCVRATGVVAHVRQQDVGNPYYKVHFALVGRFGAMIVKLEEPVAAEVPPRGARVTVVGPLVRARNGMREVQTWAVASGR